MCEPAPFAFGRRLSLQTTEEGDQRRVATLLDDFWQGEVSSLSEAVVEELAFELTLELDGQSDFHCSQCSLPDDCDQLGDRSRSHRPGRRRLDRSRMSPNPVALQPALASRGDANDFRLPDVTVRYEGDTWYWEHLGMLWHRPDSRRPAPSSVWRHSRILLASLSRPPGQGEGERTTGRSTATSTRTAHRAGPAEAASMRRPAILAASVSLRVIHHGLYRASNA